ncbi:MAG: hypothetical protein ACD_79C00747G0003 [uncultured bacterium]|nr:MAG: hypothetical protein ACD_79C00747G0003 [uncultured bacterium]
MPLSKTKLLAGLSESFGKEKADEIINVFISKAGLTLKAEYPKNEAFKICEQMINAEDKFLRIMGNSIKVQVMLMKS